MKCPIDGTELKMSERQGVEIDYCPQCRGVWLERPRRLCCRTLIRSPRPPCPTPLLRASRALIAMTAGRMIAIVAARIATGIVMMMMTMTTIIVAGGAIRKANASRSCPRFLTSIDHGWG